MREKVPVDALSVAVGTEVGSVLQDEVTVEVDPARTVLVR